MAQLLTATTGFLRDRDLFVHDGSKLRRIRLSAQFQTFLFVILLALVGWSAYSAAQLLSPGSDTTGLARLQQATELRARQIEQRQALIETMLMGGEVDPAVVQQAAAGTLPHGVGGPLDRVEDQQALQAALAAQGEAVTRVLGEMLAPVEGPRGRVIEAMRYSALGGGKRLRPFLVCESARLFDVPEARALRVAAAIEMVHLLRQMPTDA